MRKWWKVSISVVACLLLIFLLFRLKAEDKIDILKEMKIDSVGYYYDQDLVNIQNKNVNFYTTLYINRLKNTISKNIVNAKMSEMDEFNLKDFVCVLQLVKNKYSFTYDEKRQIEEYIQSLQLEKYNYTIVNGTDEEAKSVANRLYYTSEAIEIAQELGIEMRNIDKIEEYLKSFDLSSANSKEVMSLIKIDKLLGLQHFTKREIEEAYHNLYTTWSHYEDAGLQWTFDLYYMSYIFKYGNLSDMLLYSSFESDVCNIISNSNTDITFKIMFLEISRNYNLLTEQVIKSIEECVQLFEKNCSMGDNCYSLYVSQVGSIDTTYYTYVYAKACKRKLCKNSALENQLLRILENYETMNVQTVTQSLFILNEMGIDITNMYQSLYEYFDSKLSKAEKIEDTYYAIYGMDLLNNGAFELSEQQTEKIGTRLQNWNKEFEDINYNLYSRMKSVFFYLLILKYTPYSDNVEYVRNIRDFLGKDDLELDSDLRVLYFYSLSCDISCVKSKSVSKLLNLFYNKGVYYLTPDDRSKHIIMYQFMGNNLANGVGKGLPYI